MEIVRVDTVVQAISVITILNVMQHMAGHLLEICVSLLKKMEVYVDMTLYAIVLVVVTMH